MSRFDQVSDEVASGVKSLGAKAQAALFAAAGKALMGRYRNWCLDAGCRPQDALVHDSLEVARAFALERSSYAEHEALREKLERFAPADPYVAPAWFTAAQDCFICLDTAVEIAISGVDRSSRSWYILEPLFQVTTAAMCDSAEMGAECADSTDALEDIASAEPVVQDAISRLKAALDLLEGPLDQGVLDRLDALLSVVAP